MAQAQVDTQELEHLINYQGLKNLDSFAVKAKLSKIRRSLEALAKTDAIAAFHNLGILNAYQANYVDAEQFLKKALALSPQDVFILINYANILDLLGRHEDAIQTALKALQIDPLNLYAFERANQVGDLYLFPEYVEQSLSLYKGEQKNMDEFRDSNTSSTLLNFLQGIQLDVDIYRQHLTLALSIYRKNYNVSRLHTSKYTNEEASYLSTIIFVPEASPEQISILNDELDSGVSNWLQSESDGGFALADQLEGSIIYFSSAQTSMALEAQ